MDVTFRETKLFYGQKDDLNSLFGDDSPSTGGTTREGEKQKGTKIVTGEFTIGVREEPEEEVTPRRDENLQREKGKNVVTGECSIGVSEEPEEEVTPRRKELRQKKEKSYYW